MDPLSTTIVIPCFNEAERLRPGEFLGAVDAQDWLGFHFVDDGSTDGTNAMLEELCGQRPERLALQTLETNRGKAVAVREGLCAACAGGAEIVGYWDADLATPLAEIEPMARLLEEHGLAVVLGSRVRLLGRTIDRRALRHYLGRLAAAATKLTLGMDVYDTQCGAKLFRNDALLRRVLERPFTTRWIFDVELLARYQVALAELAPPAAPEARMLEYPVRRWGDVAGSKVGPTAYLRGAVDLVRVGRYLRRFATHRERSGR